MPSADRSAPRALGLQRARAQAEAIGQEIRLARIERGLRRSAASRRAGISADTQRRVELGDPSATMATLCVVAQAVGIDVVLRGYPGRGPSLRDTGQLGIAELIRAVAHPSWNVALEVPAGERGEAIDLVLFGSREIVAVEIDRMLVDFQAQYRRNVRKRDHLAGRHQRPVRLVMLIEDTRRNRAVHAAHATLLTSVLPAVSREVLQAVRTGRPLGRDGLAWIRRRRPWLPR